MHPLLTYLRRYLWIDGRAGRREWWTTMILVLMLGWQLDVMSIFALPLHGKGYGIDGVIRVALSVLLFWIDFASTIRRVHDRGKSGWSALPFIFPGAGWMWMVIECGMLPSQKGRNRYGPEPGTPAALRELPSLEETLSAFDGKAPGPWSKRAASARETQAAAATQKPARPTSARPVPARPEPQRAAPQPAMARERARAARRPVLPSSAVTRVDQSRGKTILILAAAVVMGLIVATYVMNAIP